MIRAALVWLHRWIGLLMAGFLLMEGLTGSILAFRDELEQAISPQLYAAPHPGSVPLDVATLAERIEAQEPQARLGFFSVYPRQVVAHCRPRIDATTGRPYRLDFTEAFFDPWTGRELGKRRAGDLSQGSINLVSFIYELHMSLVLGGYGTLALGIVALAWTIDCFIAFYLTLPRSIPRFWGRWNAAWRVKRERGLFRVNFDLHRAGGLWTWALLLVFAWSSVMFNLTSVYDLATRPVLDMSDMDRQGEFWNHPHPNPSPKIGWQQARRIAEVRMSEMAAQHGLHLGAPGMFGYLSEIGVYTYGVSASSDVQERIWNTGVWIDGDTGALVDFSQATGQSSGLTAFTWLRALHFGDVYGRIAYRTFVCVLGLVLCMLSITGVYIWWRKRCARKTGQKDNRHFPTVRISPSTAASDSRSPQRFPLAEER